MKNWLVKLVLGAAELLLPENFTEIQMFKPQTRPLQSALGDK